MNIIGTIYTRPSSLEQRAVPLDEPPAQAVIGAGVAHHIRHEQQQQRAEVAAGHRGVAQAGRARRRDEQWRGLARRAEERADEVAR